jgi:hypothetical protein
MADKRHHGLDARYRAGDKNLDPISLIDIPMAPD